MLIDCDGCAVRGTGCADCVVTVLLAAPAEPGWDAVDRTALHVLADAGLVPRLRHTASLETRHEQPHAQRPQHRAG